MLGGHPAGPVTGVSPDYDYNDLVAMLHAQEYRKVNGDLVQIEFDVKALARGAGWTSAWQFNMDAAFPGAHVIATVNQYYANGTPHGAQRVWTSANGASVPVFAPTKDALPKPPDKLRLPTLWPARPISTATTRW